MPMQSLEDKNCVKTGLTKSLKKGNQVLQPDKCTWRSIEGLKRGKELVAKSTIIRLVMALVLGKKHSRRHPQRRLASIYDNVPLQRGNLAQKVLFLAGEVQPASI
ncbi:hypothetical protein QBC33DRAFT_519906 [Phialemonium atrogriseum]|uniref:Uncharacterized protein n=1 Tax=Phialemonium atrogriseum TaxID=1093897 RepID=A0AAJ0FHC6_9PEZI|nr:uncharacterized protein QBC33DRAFT_519906 [Phialemonium atrogriseum]KAK1762029.1 hypothetical protein QBC33DRAFT_519906 [Phialemonium atrogriseum]